jgi:hypothetical protein
LYATEINALHGRDGLRVVHSAPFTTRDRLGRPRHKHHVYSPQIGARLQANQGHDVMAFARAEPDDLAARFRPLQPKQKLSCLTSIFLDVSAAVPKEPG